MEVFSFSCSYFMGFVRGCEHYGCSFHAILPPGFGNYNRSYIESSYGAIGDIPRVKGVFDKHFCFTAIRTNGCNGQRGATSPFLVNSCVADISCPRGVYDRFSGNGANDY